MLATRCGVVKRQLAAAISAAALLFCRVAFAQNLSPDEAVRRMTVPPGIAVNCFAAEPMVRQPVAMTFDDRGRLWVIQYLQYPNPAGLRRVSVDRYSRTVYDRVPEPPPHGPRGADRITILDDTDRDGRADTAQDFVAGLNLASGLAHGNGGLYVIQVPYLLFYPDRDGDDVPDSDPKVLLSGFGMEDAHAVANSLVWGPDGWLYGAQGSTVTANIRGISFQQGIWRYHPPTDRFELFAEGGGNTWGVDFDAQGELIAGTNVGPYAMLHQVQGGYYWKSFGKHGALHNPYTFGYLEHVPYTGFVGGHVTCGGIIYQGAALPPEFAGKYLAANLLSHAVYYHALEPSGASFVARHGGALLEANDPWFAPVDLCVAPDGAVLVADWHDQRTAHPDPDADWDRSNGRIYRLQGAGAPRVSPQDLAKLPTAALIDLLTSASGWQRTTARRLLAERREAGATAELRARLAKAVNSQAALAYLWALDGSGGLDEPTALALLSHREAAVRGWTVRLLADQRKVSTGVGTKLAELAERDPSPLVRSRLASAAQRLPAESALLIVGGLLRHDEDLADQHLPLLIWWALERHADDRESVLALFRTPEIWKHPLASEVVAPRLARRFAAAGAEADFDAVRRMVESAATIGDSALAMNAQTRLLAGIAAGVQGRRFDSPPAALRELLHRAWSGSQRPSVVVDLALRLRYQPAHAWARQQLELAATGVTTDVEPTVELLGLVAETGAAEDFSTLCLQLVATKSLPSKLRGAAIKALGSWNEPAISHKLLASYPELSADLRDRVREVLVSRPGSAAELISAVESQAIPPADVSADQLRRIAEHHQAELDRRVLAIWGQVRQGTPEERLAVVRRLNNDLRAAPGNAKAGKKLFREHCGTCHKLFGDGESIGPDLTSANRQDRDFLLVSLVDPSAQIRKEFMNYACQTTDGRVLTGLIVDESIAGVTLVDARNQRTTIARDDIAELEPADASLMPEGIVEKLTPGQLRDLFAYVQSAAAPVEQVPAAPSGN